MKHSEGFFQGVAGLELYYQRWGPDKDHRAILAIIHGFGEHSGRYMNVVGHLTSRGYVVYGLDHRGHGRSHGQRGHIGEWGEYRGDVKAFLHMIMEQESGRPIFLLGHSMGALIALDYILRHPEGLRGAIISGAPMEPVVTKPYLLVLARLLSWICPRISFNVGLDKSALSRDPAVLKSYEEDPLVHGVATPRWAAEFFSTREWVKTHLANVRIPILIIHGEADRMNLSSGSRSLYEKVTSPDKQLEIYPRSYHRPHEDLDYKQVMKDLEQWLEKHS